jgi:hypothetical protein
MLGAVSMYGEERSKGSLDVRCTASIISLLETADLGQQN